ncbi:hypothetical protein P9112_013381 [Eukaryota sp. TZLM1-RC]
MKTISSDCEECDDFKDSTEYARGIFHHSSLNDNLKYFDFINKYAENFLLIEYNNYHPLIAIIENYKDNFWKENNFNNHLTTDDWIGVFNANLNEFVLNINVDGDYIYVVGKRNVSGGSHLQFEEQYGEHIQPHIQEEVDLVEEQHIPVEGLQEPVLRQSDVFEEELDAQIIGEVGGEPFPEEAQEVVDVIVEEQYRENIDEPILQEQSDYVEQIEHEEILDEDPDIRVENLDEVIVLEDTQPSAPEPVVYEDEPPIHIPQQIPRRRPQQVQRRPQQVQRRPQQIPRRRPITILNSLGQLETIWIDEYDDELIIIEEIQLPTHTTVKNNPLNDFVSLDGQHKKFRDISPSALTKYPSNEAIVDDILKFDISFPYRHLYIPKLLK